MDAKRKTMKPPAESPESPELPLISHNNDGLPQKRKNDELFMESRTSAGKRYALQKRHILILLGFIGVFNNYTMIVSLSVAIVAMTNATRPASANTTICTRPAELFQAENNHSVFIQSPLFSWDSVTQGHILASYFYGYLCMQFPSAWLSRRFGGKYIFGIGILVAGVVTLILPKAVEWGGAVTLIVLRVLEGLSTGCAFPAMHQLLTKWSPSRERTKLCALVFTGAPIGTMVSMALSGYVGDRLGWQYIFYVFGALSCGWFIFWATLVFNSPHEHSTITQSEKDLLAGDGHCVDLMIDSTHCGENAIIGKLKPNDAPVPWKKFLLSPAVWAIFLGQFGHNWGNFTLLTSLPIYMRNIQQVHLSSNGFFSALPYVLYSLIGVIGAVLSDYLRHRNYVSTTNMRKICQTIGNLVPAACIVAVGHVGCNWITAVILLVVGTGFSGLTSSGFQVNFQDLSPVFAPLIFGVSTTLTAAFAIILPPHVVGIITASGQTEFNWRIIFYISGAIRLATTVFFDVFASGEAAAWNYIGDRIPAAQTELKTGEERWKPVDVAHDGRRRHTLPALYL